MSKNYITDYEIDAITSAIYNDDNKTLFKNLPKGVEDVIERQDVIDLSQGQEYYIVPETTLMIRKDGRVINVKHKRPIKALWLMSDICVNVSQKQIKFSEVYKQQGWKFDHKEISERYRDNNWQFTVSKLYKQHIYDRYSIKT